MPSFSPAECPVGSGSLDLTSGTIPGAERSNMSHPCQGHDCDHCYLCDVMRVCCSQAGHPSQAGVASSSPSSGDLQSLRQAVIDDIACGSHWSQLVQQQIAGEHTWAECVRLLSLTPVQVTRAGKTFSQQPALNDTRFGDVATTSTRKEIHVQSSDQ